MVDVDIDRVWSTVLLPKLQDIFRGDRKITYQGYMDIYGAIYAALQPDPYAWTVNDSVQELYNRLVDFSDDYTAKVCEVASADDAELHGFYEAEWARFRQGIVSVKGLFTLANRGWVRRKQAARTKALL
ncbi:hypothetical protein DFH09DRAFT_1088088 [Mycena vulgaris]|nr:hypothetical protein DFH09DRAFT_1088088 [Mycena vulgaris]